MLHAKIRITAAAIGISIFGAIPASANTYNFTLTDAGTGDPVFAVIGTLTTDSVLNGGNPDGYNIISMSGTLTYNNINYAITGPVGGNVPLPGGNNIGCCIVDNVLINGLPWVSNTGGWAFTANGFTYNPYHGGGGFGDPQYVYLWGNDPNAQANGLGSRMILEVIETPLPGALMLFGTGFGLMGLLVRRRKREVRDVLAPV